MQVVELLVGAAAYLETYDDEGWTALHLAAQNSHLQVLLSDSSLRDSDLMLLEAGRENS